MFVLPALQMYIFTRRPPAVDQISAQETHRTVPMAADVGTASDPLRLLGDGATPAGGLAGSASLNDAATMGTFSRTRLDNCPGATLHVTPCAETEESEGAATVANQHPCPNLSRATAEDRNVAAQIRWQQTELGLVQPAALAAAVLAHCVDQDEPETTPDPRPSL